MEGDVAAAANDVFREQEKLDKLRLDIEKARADLAKQRKAPTQIGGGGSLGGISGGIVSGEEIAQKNLLALNAQQDKLLSSIDNKKIAIAQKQLRINAITAQTINLESTLEKSNTTKESSITAQVDKKVESVNRQNKAYADAVQVQQRLLDVQKEMAAISQKEYDTDVKREALTRLGKPLMEGKFAGTQNATLAEGVAQQETTNAQMLLAAEQNRKIAIDEINVKLVEQQTLAQSIGQSFANIFQNVVTAKDPFEALGNSVKQLVIDLTAAAIKMLVIKAIMTAINPAGAAISKVGGIVGSIIGGGGFAKGGVSYGPQGGHMELLHGTEAVLTPSQMSGLVRNSMNAGAVQSMGSNSGQDMNISGEFVARGQDLVLALQRSNYALNLRRGS
jgi:hypothetical protein